MNVDFQLQSLTCGVEAIEPGINNFKHKSD
jgi:hypothetical protein